MKIIETPDKKLAQEIRIKLKENEYYCPCRFNKTTDTKCMCKEFREQITEGACHCGLFIKVNDKGEKNDKI